VTTITVIDKGTNVESLTQMALHSIRLNSPAHINLPGSTSLHLIAVLASVLLCFQPAQFTWWTLFLQVNMAIDPSPGRKKPPSVGPERVSGSVQIRFIPRVDESGLSGEAQGPDPLFMLQFVAEAGAEGGFRQHPSYD
jgi:hypothetical protein